MKTITLFIVLFIAIAFAPLDALIFSGNTGFAIPVGSWADHHSPAPYLSLGADVYQRQFLSLGLSLEMTSFRGKLNNNYHLQVISPGATVTLYPLHFIKNRVIFLRETLSYSFLQRNLHDATEKGRDFGLLSVIGFEFHIGERWGIVPYFGEKHYLGSMDMFMVGLEISFKK